MNPPETVISPAALFPLEEGALQPPPILEGFLFDPEEALQARNTNRLLSIQMDLGRRFLFGTEGKQNGPRTLIPRKLRIREVIRVIAQAKDLGARSVVLSGISDFQSCSHFRGLTAYIHSLNLIPVAAAEALTISPELAAFLNVHGASVLIRTGNLTRAAKEGNLLRYLLRIMRPLWEADFPRTTDSRRVRLGLSVTDNDLDEDTALRVWNFCRGHSLYPVLRSLTPSGLDEASALSPDEAEQIKKSLLRLDREQYGYAWLPFTPHPGAGCFRHRCSLFVNCEGNILPCGGTALDKNSSFLRNGVYPYNIRERTLAEIFGDTLFRYLRNIDQHLEGKSGDCAHLDTCIGCRGMAYTRRSREGVEPLSALRSECPHCFKEKGESHGQSY